MQVHRKTSNEKSFLATADLIAVEKIGSKCLPRLWKDVRGIFTVEQNKKHT